MLKAVGLPELQPHIDKAEAWLRAQEPKTVLDAAATLIALQRAQDAAAAEHRRRCLELIRGAQDESGGWGPYKTSAPEPFDTAVVLLALASAGADGDPQSLRERGRAYLIASQLDDGSWPATTRPPGADSYAQTMSTTAWATQALLISGETVRP